MPVTSDTKTHRRISTLLLTILSSIAAIVLLGLVVMTFRLIEIQNDLGALRNSALPRLAKLSQLSQEAVSTVSIAPALSAEPTRFEFETLLSRIKDKEVSQKALIDELSTLIQDEKATETLRRNGELLMGNLGTMTDVVSQQIVVRKRLEEKIEYFRASRVGSPHLDLTRGREHSLKATCQGPDPSTPETSPRRSSRRF